MQSTETTFAELYRCEELATQLLSWNVFLGVILLGMNKPSPWKFPWSGSKEAKPKMKIQQWANKRKLAERWSYGYGSKTAKDRVEGWERHCNDSTCSLWLSCLFLSNPTCFFQHISWRVSLESVINKRKSSCHFAWRNGSIAAWMFVHPTNTAVILDLKGFLINHKLFLLTSEYHYSSREKVKHARFLKSP